jgi:hypothetical protein
MSQPVPLQIMAEVVMVLHLLAEDVDIPPLTLEVVLIPVAKFTTS